MEARARQQPRSAQADDFRRRASRTELAPAARVVGVTYQRREPELGTLHQVVRDNIETLFAAVSEGEVAAALPDFVRKELEAYLDCGLLSRGFALLACDSCDERHLRALSCKRRGFCPACLGRRMAQSSANLLEHVLPSVPLRQFVLTLPFELRPRLTYDGALLGATSRVFVDSVLGFYSRRLHALGLTESRGKGGAVTVVQRTSADLRANPHLHSVVLDGVFVADPGGSPVFHPMPRLDDQGVADLLQVVRARLLRLFVRRGVVALDDDALTVLPDGLAEREPALARLAVAAVSGLAPAGPERRDRATEPLRLRRSLGVQSTGPLCASELGFSLHAATTAAAEDRRAREALVRYVLRPPIAQDRLELLPDDLVRIRLRRPFADGTTAIDLDPLSLLCRLCAAIVPPRFNTVRYAGVLAPASAWRAQVVPPPPETSSEGHPQPPATSDTASPSSRPSTHRSRWRPWQELLKRSFAIDVETCPSCGGKMKLERLVLESSAIARFLRSIGASAEPPPRAAARDPPFFKSRVLRRRLEPDAPRQAEMPWS